jgi:hypothetical protein
VLFVLGSGEYSPDPFERDYASICPSGAVTLAAASQTSFVSGDVLTFTAPATPDATLGNVAFGISGVRP